MKLPSPDEISVAIQKFLFAARKVMPGGMYINFLENLKDHIEDLLEVAQDD